MKETTLKDFLGDLGPMNADSAQRSTASSLITIRLPPETKARYDLLQERSRKRFGKKAREALIALIEIAEAKTA